jgi:hypothetical protein
MRLTSKQIRFAELYTGNGTTAAIESGYSKKSASAQATQLLKNPLIIEAIQEHESVRTEKRIATREQRQVFWTTIMLDDGKHMKDRLRASELLGKSNGDFMDRVSIDIPGLIIRMPELVPVGTPVAYETPGEA